MNKKDTPPPEVADIISDTESVISSEDLIGAGVVMDEAPDSINSEVVPEGGDSEDIPDGAEATNEPRKANTPEVYQTRLFRDELARILAGLKEASVEFNPESPVFTYASTERWNAIARLEEAMLWLWADIKSIKEKREDYNIDVSDITDNYVDQRVKFD